MYPVIVQLNCRTEGYRAKICCVNYLHQKQKACNPTWILQDGIEGRHESPRHDIPHSNGLPCGSQVHGISGIHSTHRHIHVAAFALHSWFTHFPTSPQRQEGYMAWAAQGEQCCLQEILHYRTFGQSCQSGRLSICHIYAMCSWCHVTVESWLTYRVLCGSLWSRWLPVTWSWRGWAGSVGHRWRSAEWMWRSCWLQSLSPWSSWAWSGWWQQTHLTVLTPQMPTQAAAEQLPLQVRSWQTWLA